MRCGIVPMIVDPHHDVKGALLYRGRDHHFLDTLIEMRLQGIRGPELPAAFEYDIDSIPSDLRRHRTCGEFDRASINLNRAILRRYVVLPAAVNGIKFQKVGGDRCAAFRLVDMDKFKIGAVPTGPQR